MLGGADIVSGSQSVEQHLRQPSLARPLGAQA